MLNIAPIFLAASDPMEQFKIVDLFPLGPDGVLAFSNASLWMFIAVAVVIIFMWAGSRKAALVPGRMQSAAEVLVTFISDMLRDTCGPKGMKFLPYVFTLFTFIFAANLLGLIPSIPGSPHEFHVFTSTSHLAVTLALAFTTFFIVVITGFAKQGLGFLKIFVPSGLPFWLLPLIVLIEVVSFLSRPLSLGIRLFANMLAGHLILKLFAMFTVMLFSAGGVVAVLGIFPILGNVAIILLEILVAFLQAYVFSMLTCIYLNDAVNGAHH